MKKILFLLLCCPLLAMASSGLHLDKAPDVQGDKAALQNGARLFVNYCMSCHGLSFVRYNQLTQLGLSEDQIINNLMFTGDKIGDLMRVAINPADARRWFGVTPPDLSLVARARASGDGSGADWLYTYLRSFYRDPKRPTGWNNVVFENVGMPHVLWQLQGENELETHKDDKGVIHKKLLAAKPGQLSPAEYDKQVGDLVGFLVWAAEPGAGFRRDVGIGILAFLAIFFVFAYALKKEFWRDVH